MRNIEIMNIYFSTGQKVLILIYLDTCEGRVYVPDSPLSRFLVCLLEADVRIRRWMDPFKPFSSLNKNVKLNVTP